jgi:hypothetical protein
MNTKEIEMFPDGPPGRIKKSFFCNFWYALRLLLDWHGKMVGGQRQAGFGKTNV